MLQASGVTVRLGGKTIVEDISFSIKEGQWLMLAGPNGAGKSTLIRAVSSELPCQGEIQVMGRNLRAYQPAQLARVMGVLSQQHHVGYAYTVEEVVSLGRYAHAGFLSGGDDEGEARVEEALALTGLTDLRRASVLTLSGGELQRAFLAQVFAQNPCLLLLDEPANHLDLKYQQHLFERIGQWLKTPGRAVVSVVHDLSLAKRYGTHALLMSGGRCAAQGDMDAVLTGENLDRVYGMDVRGWMRAMYGQWAGEEETAAAEK